MKAAMKIVSIMSLLFCGPCAADEDDLVWSTFLGGNDWDEGYNIAIDDSGNAYLTGYTYSSDFPATPGTLDNTSKSTTSFWSDAFIAKLNPTGSVLIYCTLLGGSRTDTGHGLAVDDSGNAYVIGNTESADFPTTAGAFDTTFEGIYPYYWIDVFVAKLNSKGSSLCYSTFLGGDSTDMSYCIEVDSTHKSYIAGATNSDDFPTTAGAYNNVHHGGTDIFVTRLNPSGSRLDYSTLLGGSSSEYALDISIDHYGRSYLTGYTWSNNFPITTDTFDSVHNGGSDAFLIRLNPMGTALDFATYLGGNGNDEGHGIVVDKSKAIFMTGKTESANFPTTAGAFNITFHGNRQVFVTKLSPTGTTLIYSTYMGGSGSDWGRSIDVDGLGNAYVTGRTESIDFPTTAGAFDTTFNGGFFDAFVGKLNPTGNALCYCTFLGGNLWDDGYDIAVADSGSVYIAGSAGGGGFPTTTGAFDTVYNGGFNDIFVSKFDLTSYLVPVVLSTSLTAQPKTYVLNQNYPNPFNAGTEIRYQLPRETDVSLRIYNIIGQMVRTLAEAHQPAGFHTATWDGTDDAHRAVASGIYFCRLQAGDFSETIKMALVR